MKRFRRELHALIRGLAFLSPWLIGFIAFTAIPVGLSLYYSFCDYSVLQAPVWSGLENYSRLFRDDLFWLSLKNTLYFAAGINHEADGLFGSLKPIT